MLVKRNSYNNVDLIVRYFDHFTQQRIKMESIFVDLTSKTLKLKNKNIVESARWFIRFMKIGFISNPEILEKLIKEYEGKEKIMSTFIKICGAFQIVGYNLKPETHEVANIIRNYGG